MQAPWLSLLCLLVPDAAFQGAAGLFAYGHPHAAERVAAIALAAGNCQPQRRVVIGGITDEHRKRVCPCWNRVGQTEVIDNGEPVGRQQGCQVKL